MAFQRGQSGNPAGRPAAGKAFADMLRVALSEAHGESIKLRAIADRLVDEAIDGNVQAIREIADRLDGKASQPLEHSGSIARNMDDLADAELMAIARGDGIDLEAD